MTTVEERLREIHQAVVDLQCDLTIEEVREMDTESCVEYWGAMINELDEAASYILDAIEIAQRR